MKQPVIPSVFFVLFAICMIAVVMHLFPVGDPRLPSYADFISSEMPIEQIPRQADSVALRYNRQAGFDSGASSVVTATILDYRAYDTLYETAVLFTAAIAVLSVIGTSACHKDEDDE